MRFIKRWENYIVNKIIANRRKSNAVHALSQMDIYLEETMAWEESYSREDENTIHTYLSRQASPQQQKKFDKLFDQVNKMTIESAKGELENGVLSYYLERWRRNWGLYLIGMVTSAILIFSTLYILTLIVAILTNDQNLSKLLFVFSRR